MRCPVGEVVSTSGAWPPVTAQMRGFVLGRDNYAVILTSGVDFDGFY